MTAFTDIMARDFAANDEFQQSATYRHHWGGPPVTVAVIVQRRGELGADAGELISADEIVTRCLKTALASRLPEIGDSLEIDSVRYDYQGVVSEDLVAWRLRWSRATPMSTGGVQTIPPGGI